MLIEQIWTDNPWRNFNYLVACPESLEALLIDPSDAQLCLRVAGDRGWHIKQILNTHEHYDHIEGNRAVVAATGARILAHYKATDKIAGVEIPLKAGAVVRVGSSVELQAMDTPGHTMSHICLLSKTAAPVLFSGDTLFNAGVGNCLNGGHPDYLYRTFSEQLNSLPDATLVYPGHDYIVNNLRFTLDREPGNQRAAELLDQVQSQDTHYPLVTSIGLEKEINCFFRLDNPEIIENLRLCSADFPTNPDPKAVFLALRELRNAW